MSGNPVRIGDGCATVTGYELPHAGHSLRQQPLIFQIGKAGARFQARSQDTGQIALVGSRHCGTNLSVKEKDEASPFRECGAGFAECLHSPICRV